MSKYIEVDDPEFEKQFHHKRLWNEYTIAEREQMRGCLALSRQWGRFNKAVRQELERIKRKDNPRI